MKKILMVLAVIITFVICGYATADDVYWKTKVIDGNDTWTDPIPVGIGGSANIRIHPDTSPIMTIHAQCRYRKETTWYDMDHWDLTAASVDIIHTTAQPEPEPVQMRLGCKAAGCTSGNCTVRIGTDKVL